MLGIVLVDKPLGITSHDVVDRLRRRFKTRRIGHAGTLDPLGTGLLVAAVGPATRFLQYLSLEPKEYVVEIGFGRETNTYDAEGETVAELPVPDDLPAQIREVLPAFKGLITQLPPMYSAVKRDGKPLYFYARRGEEVARDPRTIHVEAFDIESIEGNIARARIVCSGGTYVRTLAQDLGQAVGCGAHLTSLTRTRAGRFTLEQAVSLDEVGPEHVLSLADALPPLPLVPLNAARVQAIREGQRIRVTPIPDAPTVGLLGPDGSVVGVARVMAGTLQPECVIPAEAIHDSI